MGASPLTPTEPQSGVTLHTTGQIVATGSGRAKDEAYLGLKGSSRDALMKRIRESAYDDSIFDEAGGDPFIFFVEPSNTNIDFYGTRMMTSSLKAYAKNMDDGISFLNDHDYTQRLGQSVAGWYKPTDDTGNDGNPMERVIGAFFTMPGRRFSNMATDDFIAGLRSGIFRDVSVSFFSEDTRCSVCGKDMYRGWLQWLYGECDHVPGMKYEVEGENGKKESRLCYIEVHNGYIVETSNVYDGATPNAAYLKANMMNQLGRLDNRMIAQFEQQFRQKLPVRTKVTETGEILVNGISLDEYQRIQAAAQQGADAASVLSDRATGKDNDMAGKDAATATVTVDWAQLRPGLVELANSLDLTVADDATPDTILELIGDTFTELRSKVTDLESDAEVGRNYRTELVEDALKAGVRAKGEAFKEDIYKGVLSRSSIDGIKQMREDWIAEGDSRLSGDTGQLGGRRTVVGDNPIDPAAVKDDEAEKPAKRDNVTAFKRA